MTPIPFWTVAFFVALCAAGIIACLLDMRNIRTEIGILVHLALIMFFVTVMSAVCWIVA